MTDRRNNFRKVGVQIENCETGIAGRDGLAKALAAEKIAEHPPAPP